MPLRESVLAVALLLVCTGCGRERAAEETRKRWAEEAAASEVAFKELVNTIQMRITKGPRPTVIGARTKLWYGVTKSSSKYTAGMGRGTVEVTVRYRRTEPKQVIEWLKGYTVGLPGLEYDDAGNGTFRDEHREIGYYKSQASQWEFDREAASQGGWEKPFTSQMLMDPVHRGEAVAARHDAFPFAEYRGQP